MDGVFNLILNAHYQPAPGSGEKPRYGGFQEPPEELAGDKTRFEFQTALTEAFTELKRQEALDVTAQYAQLIELESDAVDNFDMDEIARDSLGNFKTKWTRPKDEVKQIRVGRAEQVQAQQAQANAAQLIDTMSKARPENVQMLKQDVEQGAAA
jgi:hypothetical protein